MNLRQVIKLLHELAEIQLKIRGPPKIGISFTPILNVSVAQSKCQS